MLGAGVPAAIYNRYDDPGTAKVKIARAVLDELQELGPPGWRIQRKIAALGRDRPRGLGVADNARWQPTTRTASSGPTGNPACASR